MVYISNNRGTYSELVQQKIPTLRATEFSSADFENHIKAYEAHVDRKAVDACWFSQTLDHDLKALLTSRFEIVFPPDVDQKDKEENIVYLTRRDESTTELIEKIRKVIAPKGIQAATAGVLGDCKWDPTVRDLGTLRIYAALHEQKFVRFSKSLDEKQRTDQELVKLYLECFAHVKKNHSDSDDFSTAKILERLGESEKWTEWKSYASHVFAMCLSVDNNDDYMALIGAHQLIEKSVRPSTQPNAEPVFRKIKVEKQSGATSQASQSQKDLAQKLKEARAKYAEKHRNLECHTCGKKGHIAPNCPLAAYSEERSRPEPGRRTEDSPPASSLAEHFTPKRAEKVFRPGTRKSPRFAASAKSELSSDDVRAKLKSVKDPAELRKLVLLAYNDHKSADADE